MRILDLVASLVPALLHSNGFSRWPWISSLPFDADQPYVCRVMIYPLVSNPDVISEVVGLTLASSSLRIPDHGDNSADISFAAA